MLLESMTNSVYKAIFLGRVKEKFKEFIDKLVQGREQYTGKRERTMYGSDNGVVYSDGAILAVTDLVCVLKPYMTMEVTLTKTYQLVDVLHESNDDNLTWGLVNGCEQEILHCLYVMNFIPWNVIIREHRRLALNYERTTYKPNQRL